MDRITHDNYQSKYMDDEHPILIRIPIARALNSDRQAYFLQQVRYWITINKQKPRNRHYFHDGRWWMYNTLNDWHAQFPWLTVRTIQRIIKELKLRKILITGNYNKKRYDKTVWYSIDERKLDALIDEHMSVWTKSPHGYGQKVHMDMDKKSEPLPETYQQISAEAGEPPAATLNNQNANTVVKAYIEQMRCMDKHPGHKTEQLVKKYNQSSLTAADVNQVLGKLKNWFKTADDYTVKKGYPFGYFIKDYDSIEKPPRVRIGNCPDCKGSLYQDEEHTHSHYVTCYECNTAINYTGSKRDDEILQRHKCDPAAVKYQASIAKQA